MRRRRFESTTWYVDGDAKTALTSLRGQGVSIEAWIALTEPVRWGVRVRVAGETFRLGDEGQAPGPQHQ